MKHTLTLLRALLLVSSLSAQGSRPPEAFQSGDRWCVLGDSITRSGWYHRYVELFYLTRFPARKLDVINCGISGDTASGGLQRLKWDCLDAKPTVVSVMFGMNDVAPGLFRAAAPTPAEADSHAKRAALYDQAMRQLTRTLVESGAKVILITPSIFDDTATHPRASSPGCGAALAGYARRVRAIANEFKVPVVDFNGPMTAINAERQKRDPRFTIVGGDRIHPTQPGHLVMAHEFLRAQKLTGVVSRIVIDAAAGKAGILENCTVERLDVQDGEIGFTCLENALPFPVESAAKPGLDLVPWVRNFNQEILQVTGLVPGDYALSIDGQGIWTFTAAELNVGVNLAAETNAPQSRQASVVLVELQKKWDLVAKLRNLAVCEHTAWPDAPRPVDLARMPAKLDARLARAGGTNKTVIEAHRQYLEFKPRETELLREVDDAMNAAQRAAQPRPHIFALRRVHSPLMHTEGP